MQPVNNPDARDSEERRLKALIALREGYWKKVETRRPVEWKVGLAIWTALAVFTATVLTSKDIPVLPGGVLVLAVGLITLGVSSAHFAWIKGMERANRFDKAAEQQFAEELMKIAASPLKSELEERLQDIKANPHWNAYFHIVVTGLLSISAIFAVWGRTASYSSLPIEQQVIQTIDKTGQKDTIVIRREKN
jgi:hypothetical protein